MIQLPPEDPNELLEGSVGRPAASTLLRGSIH